MIAAIGVWLAAGAGVADCDVPAAEALSTPPSPDRGYGLDEVGASGLLLDAAAKAAYDAVLGPLREESWLAELDGPSPLNRLVRIAGRSFLLVSACMNHDCYDNNVVLLYAAADSAIYGEVHRSGRVTLLGAPPPDLERELHRLWREEFRQGQP